MAANSQDNKRSEIIDLGFLVLLLVSVLCVTNAPHKRCAETRFLNVSFILSSSDNAGLGFLDSPETPLPPPPPCLEVLSSEISPSLKYTVDPLNLGERTLLKGRVNTQEVFCLSNSDLVPGIYMKICGLKLWEGSLDLVKALSSEVKNGNLSFCGKRVLELGCGHGLPGVFACLEGAAAVHFQDFNAEVIRFLTIPNVNANLLEKNQPSEANVSNSGGELRFFAGDWSEIHKLLPHVQDNEKDLNHSSGHGQIAGYDIILMAETVYSNSTLRSLYELIKKCTSCPHGVVYMAAKKYYFGVGGGTRRFLSLVEKDGIMAASLVAEVADGSSNVREVWKLSFM
ncbi:histidine protein methyltransferase 1 homolog [Carya illinoinensis]|uniref:histidine protein methyltransferase 1 homolog n=1 Tax=Carya illinoinensis TaxID=32201 RepID=UPI001C728487|nr:histidine protein methyltransferase 1 homolog [Carya illinoinensis]